MNISIFVQGLSLFLSLFMLGYPDKNSIFIVKLLFIIFNSSNDIFHLSISLL